MTGREAAGVALTLIWVLRCQLDGPMKPALTLDLWPPEPQRGGT